MHSRESAKAARTAFTIPVFSAGASPRPRGQTRAEGGQSGAYQRCPPEWPCLGGSCLPLQCSVLCSHRVSRIEGNFLFFFLKDFSYLFFDRGEWREKERGRNTNVWLPLMCPQLGTWLTTQAWSLTGNRTFNPSVRRPALSPLSHTSQGRNFQSNGKVMPGARSQVCPCRSLCDLASQLCALGHTSHLHHGSRWHRSRACGH